MGRKKIEIKYIKNPRQRKITFNKRRKGLIKKIKQLAALCGVETRLEITDAAGKKSFMQYGKIGQIEEDDDSVIMYDEELEEDSMEISKKREKKLKTEGGKETNKDEEKEISLEEMEYHLKHQEKFQAESQPVLKLDPVYLPCPQMPQFFIPMPQSYFPPIYMSYQL